MRSLRFSKNEPEVPACRCVPDSSTRRHIEGHSMDTVIARLETKKVSGMFLTKIKTYTIDFIME